MSRLRAITERDRLTEAADALERGEAVNWDRLAQLQVLDVARAGRAALLDALDEQEKADGDIERICGGG